MRLWVAQEGEIGRLRYHAFLGVKAQGSRLGQSHSDGHPLVLILGMGAGVATLEPRLLRRWQSSILAGR